MKDRQSARRGMSEAEDRLAEGLMDRGKAEVVERGNGE